MANNNWRYINHRWKPQSVSKMVASMNGPWIASCQRIVSINSTGGNCGWYQDSPFILAVMMNDIERYSMLFYSQWQFIQFTMQFLIQKNPKCFLQNADQCLTSNSCAWQSSYHFPARFPKVVTPWKVLSGCDPKMSQDDNTPRPLEMEWQIWKCCDGILSSRTWHCKCWWRMPCQLPSHRTQNEEFTGVLDLENTLNLRFLIVKNAGILKFEVNRPEISKARYSQSTLLWGI